MARKKERKYNSDKADFQNKISQFGHNDGMAQDVSRVGESENGLKLKPKKRRWKIQARSREYGEDTKKRAYSYQEASQ